METELPDKTASAPLPQSAEGRRQQQVRRKLERAGQALDFVLQQPKDPQNYGNYLSNLLNVGILYGQIPDEKGYSGVLEAGSRLEKRLHRSRLYRGFIEHRLLAARGVNTVDELDEENRQVVEAQVKSLVEEMQNL